MAAQDSLTTRTSLPFPSAIQASSGAQAAIVSEWSLSKGAVQSGGSNISFVNDPFPKAPTPGVSNSSNSTGPVLLVTYPAGSFSHGTGGSNLYKPWNTSDGSTFQSMMVSYEVAFDAGFDWVKGGKLPGLRGGADSQGCSGGRQTGGKNCFSTRLMWRKDGAGEGAYITNSIIYSFYEPCPLSVYAYIPNTSGLTRNMVSAYLEASLSLQVAPLNFIPCQVTITYSAGQMESGYTSCAAERSAECRQWQFQLLLVHLPISGEMHSSLQKRSFNDVQAISRQDLLIRNSSAVTAGGLFFSSVLSTQPRLSY